MAKYDEDVKDSECDRWYSKEIDSCYLFRVVLQKGSPIQRRRPDMPDHIPGNGRFGDIVAQEGKF